MARLTRLLNEAGDEVLTSLPKKDEDAKGVLAAFADLGYTVPDPQDSEPAHSGDVEPKLDKMKLTELLEHAEKIGVDTETLDALRKPGTSKAKVIEAITAHTAA